ncbi:probable ubiquitin-conjugating enzyme E2 25 isoform X2 [Raphanus sativus]|uniref:E2 ubiquitin-conjugating enzyme n=1 Tax=Raphanus sativus TaxID=3726 RepID=A0A6J0P1X0_RAPSA|nr:probable ubiquitin-conjugating enzyme E2 25 isoform X2 [Raphanus sativus]
MEPEIAHPVASCSITITPNKATTPDDNNGVEEELFEMQNGGGGGGVNNNNDVDKKNKGKAIQSDDDEQLEGSSSPLSNSLLDPDSLIYQDDDDDYFDHYAYEIEDDHADEYVSKYQALFDAKEKEIPAGVEVTMDWLPNSEADAKPSGSSKPIATTSSSSGSKRSGIHLTPNTAYGIVPHKIHGFKYAGPGLKYPSIQLGPKTPGTVLGEAPVPSPAPASASSGLSLQMLKKPSGYLGFASTRPLVEEVISAPNTSTVKRNMEDYLGKYLFFKKFDIVEDLVDHHYAAKGASSKQHTKEWAKRIQEEWKILENDLPEMIFVRAYESRMDLLRAVIVGADGTPYHDGLFFFDIFFPDAYPSVPPMVHYHSGGLRINPNLYDCGKVCLSLLGTWTGVQTEKWIPNESTMLQVLVSIQGLILNQKPYFNEPGYEGSAGSQAGESRSKTYSEKTFLLSLKTMVYNMRRPPKYFEDFSYGHFLSCAHDVLKACYAYRNGAPVASLVRGKVKEGEESSERCSEWFMKDVGDFVDTLLLKEFILLGVLGLEPEQEEEQQ